MEIATQKKRDYRMDFIHRRPSGFKEIENFKNQMNFDFDEEFKKGLTVEQFRTAIKERISSYNWEK